MKVERVKEDGKNYKLTYDEKNIKTKKIKIDGKNYKVMYVNSLKFDNLPISGYHNKKNRTIKIKKSLSPAAKKYVLAHEIYHAKDKTKWGGTTLQEIKAIIYCDFRHYPLEVLKLTLRGNIFEKIKKWFELFRLIVNHISQRK